MSSDFAPVAALEVLRQRAVLLRRLRRFFEARGFLEVETPLLAHEVVIDRHLDPLAVTLFDDPRRPQQGPTLWLQTSPELGMKRLLAAHGQVPQASAATAGQEEKASPGGLTAIYQITRAFRGGEVGPRHNPEFTIVEWYRVGDDYQAGMDLLAELAEEILAAGPPRRLSYRELFLAYAGVDPYATPTAALAERAGLAPMEARDLVLDYLLTQFEPQLGLSAPLIVYDYPANHAALAQVRQDDPPVAERFELYYRGLELANGYHELRDAQVLQQRMQTQNALRQADGKPPLPQPKRLLAALEHGLPPCAGCALGFDRLVMAVLGLPTLEMALPFPVARA
jgi:lysyl-tRNA synthetase class 2